MTTYVLLHGAYQGGWIWQHVAERLEGAGHRVLRPTLDGCAELGGNVRPDITTETHAADVARLLFYEDVTDITLVGTSSGGMVLCRTAELARDRIGRISFVDALALRNGEKVPDFVQRPRSVTTDLTTGPSAEDAATRLYSELEPELRQWTVDRTGKHPVGPLDLPVTLDSFWEQQWDAQVVYCIKSTNPPEAHQRRTAETLNASWHELDTGHYPMLSTPDELTAILLG